MPQESPELLRRARAGDRPALSSLIGGRQTQVAGFVAGQLGPGVDRAQVEDLCQQIFVKVVLGLPRLRQLDTFEGWLFQIARNLCRDHLRRQRWRRRLFAPFSVEAERTAAPPSPEAEQGGEMLERALAELEPGDRTLLQLMLERPRSHAELAEVLGISVAATKSRLFRTRARLGHLLRIGGALDES